MKPEKPVDDPVRPFWNFNDIESWVMVAAILAAISSWAAYYMGMYIVTIIDCSITVALCVIGIKLVNKK